MEEKQFFDGLDDDAVRHLKVIMSEGVVRRFLTTRRDNKLLSFMHQKGREDEIRGSVNELDMLLHLPEWCEQYLAEDQKEELTTTQEMV